MFRHISKSSSFGQPQASQEGATTSHLIFFSELVETRHCTASPCFPAKEGHRVVLHAHVFQFEQQGFHGWEGVAVICTTSQDNSFITENVIDDV